MKATPETYGWVEYRGHRRIAEMLPYPDATLRSWYIELERAGLTGAIGTTIMLDHAIRWPAPPPIVTRCPTCGGPFTPPPHTHAEIWPTIFIGTFALADIVPGPDKPDSLFAVVDPDGERFIVTRRTQIFVSPETNLAQLILDFPAP